jgi:hypothetical protein
MTFLNKIQRSICFRTFKKEQVILVLCSLGPFLPRAQTIQTEVTRMAGEKRVMVTVGDRPFTSLLFSDSLEKPILFPIYAADGQFITRGFPISPRDHEPTDHPHHKGLWFNYENVNGLDFWNNSYAIPPDKKNRYGWIVMDSILETKSGPTGFIAYSATWKDQQKNSLLHEITRFYFSGSGNIRIIDRITELTALQDIRFPDAKDGLLGLRVAHELELPSAQPKQFTDNKGNVTTVASNQHDQVTGNYITSVGKQGDSAWGTRARWCMLYGKIKQDSISIAIIDHPANPGFPTYWHARGYGLFAANPLGQEIFSKGKDSLGFSLKKGSTVTFRYRIVITSGRERLGSLRINELADTFEKER